MSVIDDAIKEGATHMAVLGHRPIVVMLGESQLETLKHRWQREALEEVADKLEEHRFMVLMPLEIFTAQELCDAKRATTLDIAEELRRHGKELT